MAGTGKYGRIADALRRDIDKGLYKPGDSIPTIRDLAERYGCSPQTVNKATSWLAQQGYLESRQGSGSVVSAGRRNFRPSRPMLIDKARSTHLGSTADPDNYHCRDIYLAYLLQSAENGMTGEFIVFDKEQPATTKEFESSLETAGGFLVQGSLPDEWIGRLSEVDIPAVFINRPLPEGSDGRFGAVLIDETPLDDLANYLSSLGHENIIFAFSEELEQTVILERRLRSFEAALSKAFNGRPYRLENFHFNPNNQDSQKTLKELVDRGFTAAFGFNDITALRLISLLRMIGIRVPEDFSVAGFDDLFPATMSSPPLTTITVDRGELVSQSISLLDRLIGENGPMRLAENLPTRLQIRRSCFRRP